MAAAKQTKHTEHSKHTEHAKPLTPRYFHFSLGPVQGFVAQARRMRDFWAGSFLISWLTGVAIAEVKRQGGTIVFPLPPQDYLEWIGGETGRAGLQNPEQANPARQSARKGPRHGAIPSRFKAAVPPTFSGAMVAARVRQAWVALAEHVWRADRLASLASIAQSSAPPQAHGGQAQSGDDSPTRQIWQRQHAAFWDIAWVVSDDADDGRLLEQRKHWRSHYPPEAEGGNKCMVMEGWQELSASLRPGKEGNAFWARLRADKLNDIGANEQLCALAYVKRRFARHFASFSALLDAVPACNPASNPAAHQPQQTEQPQQSNALAVFGWPLDTGMPSGSYMAAVHWLEKLIACASPEQVWLLLDAARAVNPAQDEWETRIACLQRATEGWHAGNDQRRLLALDGNLFFEHVQANAKAYDYDPEKMAELRATLDAFSRWQPAFEQHPLSPFYAVLLMDGDGLGAQLAEHGKQEVISHALAQFTKAVPGTVEQHNGFLIYAGGDDVLAVLPLEDALPCAVALRTLYLDKFAEQSTRHGGKIVPTSISAAIEYVHIKMPLGQVLVDAHQLLDDIAKDGAGRDALAVRVWKPGGMALEWAQPWRIALQDGKLQEGRLQILDCVEQFGGGALADPVLGGSAFSGKFFFKIRERFALLNPAHEGDTPLLSEDEAVDLLAVDFFNSAANRKQVTLAQARAAIVPLLRQCRAVRRDARQADIATWPVSTRLAPDGALLVRFLTQKGVS